MSDLVTVIAPFTLAAGKTEADLLTASDQFHKEFVSKERGIIRRELVRKSEGRYIDIIQFRSAADVQDIIEKEKNSTACYAFFAVMDMSDQNDADTDFYPSLATYNNMSV